MINVSCTRNRFDHCMYAPSISRSQVGTLPLHSLLAWHVLSAGPFSVYPLSHEYLATLSKEVPALVFTRPLLGLAGWPQVMFTESGQLKFMDGKI